MRYTILLPVFLLSLLLIPQQTEAQWGAALPEDEYWDSRFVQPDSTDGDIRAMLVVGKDIYVGGDFTILESQPFNHIARWDTETETWHPLGEGVDGSVAALATDGERLFVGGTFATLGDGTVVDNIAAWDLNGGGWEGLGSGITRGDVELLSGSEVVNALAFDDGILYAGGLFRAALGDRTAASLARWDRSTDEWSAIPGGEIYGAIPADASIFALELHDGYLYAGGRFDFIDANTVVNIARWNLEEETWSKLGDELLLQAEAETYQVRVIRGVGDSIYIGGRYILPGEDTTSLAVWNQQTEAWHPVDEGGIYRGTVLDLDISPSVIYVAGFFLPAGEARLNGILRYDPVSGEWGRLGLGVNSYLLTVETADDLVYVAGGTSGAGNVTVANIARWNPQSMEWSGLAVRPNNFVNSPVRSLLIDGDDLYLGGEFAYAGAPVPANRIVRWDGTQWHRFGTGIKGTVHAIALMGDDLYVGGEFDSAGTLAARNIARWDRVQEEWAVVGEGVNGTVRALLVEDDVLYVGGEFDSAGTLYARNVAAWTPVQEAWGTLGSGDDNGTNGQVNALALFDDDLYAAGNFGSAGGNAANGIARWEGNGWSNVGGGISGPGSALAVNGGSLYIGGEFDFVGTDEVEAANIARWEGGAWHPIGEAGNGVDGPVAAIAFIGSRLFVGGGFQEAGGEDASYIAEWDGTAWYPLGSGLNGRVSAMQVQGERLFVVGEFTRAGDKPSNYIGIWTMPPASVDGKLLQQERGVVLEKVQPNPVNAGAVIAFRLERRAAVSLDLYNARGERVVRLHRGALEAGRHTFRWHPEERLPEGVYLLRLQTDGVVESQAVVLIR